MKRHNVSGKSKAIGLQESKLRSMTSADLNLFPNADIKCLIDDKSSDNFVFIYDKPASQLSIIDTNSKQINVEVPGQLYAEELIDDIKTFDTWEKVKDKIEDNNYRFDSVNEAKKLFRKINEDLIVGHTYQFNDGSPNTKDAKYIKSAPSSSGTKKHQFELPNFGLKIWVQDSELAKRITESKKLNETFEVEVSLRDAKKAQDIFNDSYLKMGKATSTNVYNFHSEDLRDEFIQDLKNQGIECKSIDESVNEAKSVFNLKDLTALKDSKDLIEYAKNNNLTLADSKDDNKTVSGDKTAIEAMFKEFGGAGIQIQELNESRVKAYFDALNKAFPKLKEKDLQDIADDLDTGKEEGLLHRNYYRICTLLNAAGGCKPEEVVDQLFKVYKEVTGAEPKETIESIKEADKIDSARTFTQLYKALDIDDATGKKITDVLEEPQSDEDCYKKITDIIGDKKKAYRIMKWSGAEDLEEEADLEITEGAVELVHVYDDPEKKRLFGTGELTGKKETKDGVEGEIIKLDNSTEKWFPSNQIELVESVNESIWNNASLPSRIKLLNKIQVSENRKAPISGYCLFEHKDLPNRIKKSLSNLHESFMMPDCAASAAAWEAIGKLSNPARYKRLTKELAKYNNRNTTTFEIRIDDKTGELYVNYGEAWTLADVRYRELISILSTNGFKRAKYQNEYGIILGKPVEEEQVDESFILSVDTKRLNDAISLLNMRDFDFSEIDSEKPSEAGHLVFDDEDSREAAIDELTAAKISVKKIDESKKILNIYEDTNFPSQFGIDDEISFIPSAKQSEEMCISREPSMGTIVGVRFTKAKVFYDVLDEYYGIIFKNLDSVFVTERGKGEELSSLTESVDKNKFKEAYLERIKELYNKDHSEQDEFGRSIHDYVCVICDHADQMNALHKSIDADDAYIMLASMVESSPEDLIKLRRDISKETGIKIGEDVDGSTLGGGADGGVISMDIEPLEYTPKFESFVSNKKKIDESAVDLFKKLNDLKKKAIDTDTIDNINHVLGNIAGFYLAVEKSKNKEQIEKDETALTNAVNSYVNNNGIVEAAATKKETVTKFQIEMAKGFVESYTKYTAITDKNRDRVIEDMKVVGLKNVPDATISAILDGLLNKKSVEDIHKSVNEVKKIKRVNEVKYLAKEDADRDFPGYDEYPNISKSGSLVGMKQQYGWDTKYVIQIGNYYYNLKTHPKMSGDGVLNEDGEGENGLVDGQLVKINDPDYSLHNGYYGYIQSINGDKATISVHSTQADGNDILTKEFELEKISALDDSDNITAHDLNEEGTFNGKSAKDYIIELLGRVSKNEWTVTQFVNWAMRNKYYMPNALAVGIESVFSPKKASTENFEAIKSKIIGYYGIEDVNEYDNEDGRFYVTQGMRGTFIGFEDKVGKSKNEFPISSEEYDEWLKNKISGAELYKSKGGVVEELNEALSDEQKKDLFGAWDTEEVEKEDPAKALKIAKTKFPAMTEEKLKPLFDEYFKINDTHESVSGDDKTKILAILTKMGFESGDEEDYNAGFAEIQSQFPKITQDEFDAIVKEFDDSMNEGNEKVHWKELTNNTDVFNKEDVDSAMKHGGNPIPKSPYRIDDEGYILNPPKKDKTNESTNEPYDSQPELEAALAHIHGDGITQKQDGDDTVYLHKGVEVGRWYNNDDYGNLTEATNEDELDGVISSYNADKDSDATLDLIKSYLTKNPVSNQLVTLQQITRNVDEAKSLYNRINGVKIDESIAEVVNKVTELMQNKWSDIGTISVAGNKFKMMFPADLQKQISDRYVGQVTELNPAIKLSEQTAQMLEFELTK